MTFSFSFYDRYLCDNSVASYPSGDSIICEGSQRFKLINCVARERVVGSLFSPFKSLSP